MRKLIFSPLKQSDGTYLLDWAFEDKPEQKFRVRHVVEKDECDITDHMGCGCAVTVKDVVFETYNEVEIYISVRERRWKL